MNQPEWIDKYASELSELTQKIKHTPDVMKAEKIMLLSRQLVYIGKISNYFTRQYKETYAMRKRAYAEAYREAPKHKAISADLVIADIRDIEADLYSSMDEWKTEFETTKEYMNALKYSLKVDLEDGSSRR